MARSKIEEDGTLKNIYDNGTSSLTGSEGSTLSQKSTESYTTLKTAMRTVISRLGVDTWDDAISAEINSGTITGLETLIDSCKSPADDIMIQTGAAVSNYNTGFTSYREKVKEHNSKVDTLNTLYSQLGSEPYPTHIEGNETEAHKAYRGRLNTINQTEGEIDALAAEVEKWKKYCQQIVENIKGLLAPIASTASTGALGALIGTTSDYSGESAEKYGYGSDYTVKGTRVTDPNGNLVSETYQIVGPDGTIVETGEINYDSEQRPTTSSFYKKPPEPATVVEIDEAKAELEGKGIPGELAYVNGDVTPANVESSSQTEYTPDPAGQGTDFATRTHTELAFADGTDVVTDTTLNGSVVANPEGEPKEVLVPEQQVSDSVITTGEGEVFNYHEETAFENGVRDSALGTLSTNGEVVAQVGTDYVADYQDRTTGCDVAVQNQVVTTAGTTTTTSSIVYRTGDDGVVYEDTATVIRNNDDPSCGSITYSDGTGYSVERNSDNQLVVTEYQTDKNGEVQSYTSIINDQPDAMLSVTDHTSGTGTVTQTPINTENPLDAFVVSNTYQTARIDSGFNADAAMEGSHFLWNADGSEIEIQNPWESNPDYTMSLTLIDN